MGDPLLLFGLKERRELKKKKGKMLVLFWLGSWSHKECRVNHSSGYPLPAHGVTLRLGGRRGFSLLAPLIQSTKPSPGLQEVCRKREFCREAAARRQGRGCSLQVVDGALWKQKPVQVALGDQCCPCYLLDLLPKMARALF